MSKRTKKDLTKELAQELDVFDEMLSALVEVLEEKGVLTQEEWEQKVKIKLQNKTVSYRDIQSRQ
jgi:hypothetical protein